MNLTIDEIKDEIIGASNGEDNMKLAEVELLLGLKFQEIKDLDGRMDVFGYAFAPYQGSYLMLELNEYGEVESCGVSKMNKAIAKELQKTKERYADLIKESEKAIEAIGKLLENQKLRMEFTK